jgi:hypothetical protein
MKHVIIMHAEPGTQHAPPLSKGFYGPVAGVTINQPIYCRVANKEAAYEFDTRNAVCHVMEFRNKGYGCHAVPPITLTL